MMGEQGSPGESRGVERPGDPGRDRERRARVILDQMGQFTGLLDVHGNLLEANRAALEGTGMRPEEVLGRPFWEGRWWQVSPETPEWVREAVGRAASGESVRRDVEIFGAASGAEVITIDFSLRPVLDPKGRIQFLIAEGGDITEKRRAETRLAQKAAELQALYDRLTQLARLGVISQAGSDSMTEAGFAPVFEAFREGEGAFRALAEAIPQIVWASLPDGFVDYVNHRCYDFTGQTPEEPLGWGWLATVHPDDQAEASDRWSRAVAEGEWLDSEFRLRRADGTYRWQLARGAPLRDDRGRIARWVGTCTDIDDRKRGEAAVREGAHWLETTLDSVGDGLIATDSEGRVRLINSVAEELTGWSTDEAAGHHLEEVFAILHESTREPMENPVRRVLREGSVIGLADHTVLRARDGTEWPIDDSGAPIRGDDGSILGAVLCFRDATRRRQAEEERARLAAIVDSSDDAIIGMDVEGTIVSWNEGAHRVFGYAPGEAIGWPVAILMPSGEPEEISDLLEAVLGGERVYVEARRRRKDGGLVDVSESASPIRDESGRIVGISKIARDVTERRRAEEALRASERLARSVFDGATDVMVIADDEGRYTDVNPAAGRFFGLSCEELIGRSIAEFVEPGFDFDAAWAAFRREGFTQGSIRLIRPDGAARDVEFAAKANILPGRHLSVIRDVTERRRAEDEVHQYAGRLEALSRRLIRVEEDERRRIARELHDEIGQALTAIKINLGVARIDPADPESARRLDESLALVDRTIGQVRGLSLDLRPSMLDDLGLAPALRSYVAGLAARIGIESRFVADDRIGRLDPDIETACYRIAQEALTNVARHAGAGHLRVDLSLQGTDLRLVIADDGSGFDPAAMTIRAKQGTSLGLLGLRERATLVGGHVEIESAPGRGTTVTATFPLGSDHSGEGRA